MPEKVLIVDAADASHATRSRVLLSPTVMTEIGLGIGDVVKLTFRPVSESRSRRGAHEASSSDEQPPVKSFMAFGIAWPSTTTGHFSTY